MQHSHNFRHFVRSFFIISTMIGMLVLAFNYWVDPYAIFNSPLNKWANLEKPMVENQLRLVKALAIIQERPIVLLAGSSRVHVGLKGEDLQGLAQGKVFNAGLPGTTMAEVLGYVEHALYNQPALETLILGLDFFMFNRHRKLNVEYDPRRLKRSSMYYDDYIGTLFTMHALKNSLFTISGNIFPASPVNKLKETNIDKEWGDILAKSEKDFLTDIMIAREWYGKYEIDPRQVECFKSIVALCAARNIHLKVFFSPAQAIYWEAVNLKGLWPQLESLKETLCQIHPILDFSGYNSVTTLMAEQSGESFYSDCSHYTPFIGRMILAKLFDHSIPYDDFGRLLTPQTIHFHLDEMKKEKEEWRELNPHLVQTILDL